MSGPGIDDAEWGFGIEEYYERKKKRKAKMKAKNVERAAEFLKLKNDAEWLQNYFVVTKKVKLGVYGEPTDNEGDMQGNFYCEKEFGIKLCALVIEHADKQLKALGVT